jgi:hypothetical protein
VLSNCPALSSLRAAKTTDAICPIYSRHALTLRFTFRTVLTRRKAIAGLAAAPLARFAKRESAPTQHGIDPSDGQAENALSVTTVESRTISVRINRSYKEVYEFLVLPENWNAWAAGLGRSIRRTQDGWIGDSQDGQLKVRFTPRNDFGVVDHYVTRKSGVTLYVPMRLVTNGGGCELMFTLFREPDMSDERYAADAEFVNKDLNTLKQLLER